MLPFLTLVRHPLLVRLEMVYCVSDYSSFPHACVEEFSFFVDSGFAFAPFSALKFKSSHVCHPSISFVAAGYTTVTIKHPRWSALPWIDFLSVLTTSTHLSSLTLDTLEIRHMPTDLLISVPFPNVRYLDLKFGGLTCMAAAIKRLNLPLLEVLAYRYATNTDVACLLECTTILSTITHFVAIAPRGCYVSLRDVFAWKNRAVVLDLRLAGIEAFGSLCQASSAEDPYPNGSWTACASLRRLLLGSERLSYVNQLVEDRMMLGYPHLEYIYLHYPLGLNYWVSDLKDFFDDRCIELNIPGCTPCSDRGVLIDRSLED
ncbi:hypothetical protein C8R44DRAFT_741954 [Mycena epipterygia]|nr:hypothetical protein C8R44DRAFT_741954 [Mycena epipterygia]